MRILSITAGAADMYCGSCLRDNALATELLARGHDVTLLPVYTPTRTDEANVSAERVFFGGVSVYLQQHSSVFRRTPWPLDRLFDSPWLLRLLSKRSIQTNPGMLGALTVSTLLGERGFQRKEIDKLTHWLRTEPPYEVVNLPNALLIALAGPVRKATGAPVCVTVQGEDLFLEALPEEHRARALELIRQQVDQVDLFVAVSDYYGAFMSDYLRIPARKMRVVPLGVSLRDLEPTRRTRTQSDPFVIGFFARIAPEKGLHQLVEAYRILRHERGVSAARIECAGYLAPEHRPYLDEIVSRMREWGLEDEFRYHGALDRLQKVRFFHAIDVLSVPSAHPEPKGLYLLEAMACGVPAVEPRHGAYEEMLLKTSGGLLVPPDDAGGLADGLAAIRNHPGQAREMGLMAAAAVREHYGVKQMADRALAVYAELADAASPALKKAGAQRR